MGLWQLCYTVYTQQTDLNSEQLDTCTIPVRYRLPVLAQMISQPILHF